MNTSKNRPFQPGFELLVPVDFSDEAAYGFSLAVKIASLNGGHITLFHSTSMLEHLMGKKYDGFSSISNAFQKGKEKILNQKEQIENELSKFAKLNGLQNVSYKTKVVTGKFKDELEKYLDTNPIDLIVMGSSGKHATTESIFGNKSEQSIRLSSIPVFVVKDNWDDFNLSKILLGVELRNYESAAVKSIRTLSDYLDAKLIIAHVKQSVDEKNQEIEEILKEFALRHHLNNYEIRALPAGGITEGLTEFATANGIDIIATITKGQTGILKLIYGSDTNQLLKKSDKAILAVNEEK